MSEVRSSGDHTGVCLYWAEESCMGQFNLRGNSIWVLEQLDGVCIGIHGAIFERWDLHFGRKYFQWSTALETICPVWRRNIKVEGKRNAKTTVFAIPIGVLMLHLKGVLLALQLKGWHYNGHIPEGGDFETSLVGHQGVEVAWFALVSVLTCFFIFFLLGSGTLRSLSVPYSNPVPVLQFGVDQTSLLCLTFNQSDA